MLRCPVAGLSAAREAPVLSEHTSSSTLHPAQKKFCFLCKSGRSKPLLISRGKIRALVDAQSRLPQKNAQRALGSTCAHTTRTQNHHQPTTIPNQQRTKDDFTGADQSPSKSFDPYKVSAGNLSDASEKVFNASKKVSAAWGKVSNACGKVFNAREITSHEDYLAAKVRIYQRNTPVAQARPAPNPLSSTRSPGPNRPAV